jgi:mannose-6-phosphate isomerase-like protein (cupin superfamily)
MKEHRLESFLKGWFLGPFMPTLNSTSAFECAVKKYQAGDYEVRHYHAVATEYTVIATGRVRMNGEVYGADSIIEIKPGEATDFEALTDTITFVIKIPAISGDKYLGVS